MSKITCRVSQFSPDVPTGTILNKDIIIEQKPEDRETTIGLALTALQRNGSIKFKVSYVASVPYTENLSFDLIKGCLQDSLAACNRDILRAYDANYQIVFPSDVQLLADLEQIKNQIGE